MNDADVQTHHRASLWEEPTDSPNKYGVAFGSPKSVSSFVGGFKSAATKRINDSKNTPGISVWQSRFHDHIIRDEAESQKIFRYIKSNPKNWNNDKYDK
ncbi:MAG: hypothetical protein Q8N05_03395 [Bacteroidota bacterium]|nr:hypothetical protein [Bacteroidota bacterium]